MTFSRFSILICTIFYSWSTTLFGFPGSQPPCSPVPQADSGGSSGVAQVLFPVLSFWVAASTLPDPQVRVPSTAPFSGSPSSSEHRCPLGHLLELHTAQPEGPQLFPGSTFSGGDGVVMQSYAAKSCQSCPTLCDPIDGSPPGSPVPGILQARTLEWIAISFSNAWK